MPEHTGVTSLSDGLRNIDALQVSHNSFTELITPMKFVGCGTSMMCFAFDADRVAVIPYFNNIGQGAIRTTIQNLLQSGVVAPSDCELLDFSLWSLNRLTASEYQNEADAYEDIIKLRAANHNAAFCRMPIVHSDYVVHTYPINTFIQVDGALCGYIMKKVPGRSHYSVPQEVIDIYEQLDSLREPQNIYGYCDKDGIHNIFLIDFGSNRLVPSDPHSNSQGKHM